ncbi:porin family protein [Lutimonas vermicola]|uniref:Porin family protein n=1 Tax=Lutimonas vermicola TaxID=414288 RepID=A0ABU9L4F3_9FLAO
MKKTILLFVGLTLASVAFFAQSRDTGTIEFIPFIGYSSSNLAGDYTEDFDARSAFNFGAIGDYYFSDRWSIRSGLAYNSMGASFLGSDLKLDYLNIPLNANWHFGGTRKWNLNFGFTPGFLMKAEIEGEDFKDFVESFQLALTYGIGYKIEITDRFSILVDYQGLYGMTNINSEGGDNNINYASSFNAGAVFAF